MFTKNDKQNFEVFSENRDVSGFRGAGDTDVTGSLSGLDRLKIKKYNKGLAFSHEERQILGIHGLLPFALRNIEEQVEHVLAVLEHLSSDIEKHWYLIHLEERNQRLFYKVIASNLTKMMHFVYTPTIGIACQQFSIMYTSPRGLFITIKDKGHIYEVLKNWPETDIRVICVTDGERILGLGDVGANGMCIPLGKLTMYTALGGINPSQCLAVMLDVGTNSSTIMLDRLYIGLRQQRVTGQEYFDFIDEFMRAAVRRFGQNCLVQFEDFANENAFRILQRYRKLYCTYNDDIQGTATVALAGVLAAMKVLNKSLENQIILFMGAGEAALGFADLFVIALKKHGLSEDDAKKRIWMVDSRGLITKDRPKGGLSGHKEIYAHQHEPIDSLIEAVKILKPTILIGASAIKGAFTTEILEFMAHYNENPIIFALSNPSSKAECSAEEAYTFTKGKCIFASGAPTRSVKYDGKKFFPGQGNNTYVFPGLIMGIICTGVITIIDELFVNVAERLADLVNPEDLAKGIIYPPASQLNCVAIHIAATVMKFAFKNKLATLRPEPKHHVCYIKSQMYNLEYPDAIPETYCLCSDN